MERQQVLHLITKVFNQPFKYEYFQELSINLLKELELTPNTKLAGQYIPAPYREYVSSLRRIGKYKDSDDKEIDVLVVHLKSGHSVEHARAKQRNFIADYLNGGRGGNLKDAALVAFYSDDSPDWRFSLVKMEYQFATTESGKNKIEKKLTPARRYSFLVGENEPNHTAQKQLFPLLEDDETNPTLAQIENAFNIESVSKEFYRQYRGLYEQVNESLEKLIRKDVDIREEFKNKHIDTSDFSKKLMGQIVFLYFIQKKGWLGVPEGKKWGEGNRSFLRDLFSQAQTKEKNYFNDYLEYLFYDALNKQDRGNVDTSYYPKFQSKIPFLNGGLFEALQNYDWRKTNITLPNNIFSNTEETPEGDRGTGVLDIFDRYNFTVCEDEPFEKEVAIDPEMLGKVFENLIEENLRKGLGAFYTPREIVHYMCQESLIYYLNNSFIRMVDSDKSKELLLESLNKKGFPTLEEISQFIHYGELANEIDNHVISSGEQNKKYKLKMPDSICKWAKEIDKYLESIRVCDPAIGSGAFPVGMMTEIVRARIVLNKFLDANENRTPYIFKRHAIQNCLYGVDIDRGAVDIAKLRLWLSLVVDEEDIHKIKPLPNLDYKIMQGNSLLEEYEGIKLFDDKIIFKANSSKEEIIKDIESRIDTLQKEYFEMHKVVKLDRQRIKHINQEVKTLKKQLIKLKDTTDLSISNLELFDSQYQASQKYERLKELHQEYFETSDKDNKIKLKKQIDDLEWEFIESSLKEQGNEVSLEKLNKYRESNTKPFFLWKLHFGEVFQEKGGFDVVIANPPYSRVQTLQQTQPEYVPYYKKNYQSARGSFDIYALFIERGYSLLDEEGTFTYILPHKFFQAKFGESIRGLLTERKAIRQIVRFGAEQVFNDVTTYTCLLFLAKQFQNSFRLYDINDLSKAAELLNQIQSGIPNDNEYKSNILPSPNTKIWNFTEGKTDLVLQKLKQQSHTLGDITRKIFVGLQTSADKIYVLEIIRQKSKTVICYSKELENEVEIENGLVKPFLMGKDVHRYQPLSPKNVVIFPYLIEDHKAQLMPKTYIRSNYPMGWEYILKNKRGLSQRENGKMDVDDYYAYIYPKNLVEFERKKIITPDICNKSQMSLDNQGDKYHSTTLYSFVFKTEITDSIQYFTGILNSSLLWFYLKATGSVLRGGFIRYKTEYLNPFPIPCSLSQNPPAQSLQKDIVSLVDKVLKAKQSDSEADTLNWEKQIDQIVYELYGLNSEEIKIVEEGT